VNKGANQPSVFPDPKSSDAGLPYYSNGRRDDLMQRRYLEAALGAFDPAFGDATLNPVSPVYGGRMVACDAIYVWTWDARPYPAFPAATEVWSDCANWATGHWLTGRLGSTPLAGLVSRLLADNAITDIDCSEFGRRPGRLRDRSANVAPCNA
jgi:GTA TIM-barrel-like domain